MSSEEGFNEQEGEEEIVVNPQVVVAKQDAEAPEEDTDNNPLFSMVFSQGEGEGEGAVADAEEPEEEEEEEEDPEETDEERALRMKLKKEREAYLKRVTAFYKERGFFFRGKRAISKPQIAEFWESFKRGRNDSKLATIEKDGSLILKNKKGEIVDTIAPHSYESPTKDYHDSIEVKRQKAIKKAEIAFQTAKDSLRGISRENRGEYKEAMRLVQEADERLHRARYAIDDITIQWPVLMNQLIFDNKYNDSKKVAFCFIGAPMTLQQRYAIEIEPGKALATNAEERIERIQDKDIILVNFAEGPNRYLSSWYMRELTYKDKTYNCAYQAIMSEMAGKFNNYELAGSIMDANDPQDMSVTWDQLSGATEKKWRERLEKVVLKVNRAKFTGKKMTQALLATGDKHIGYIPPENAKDAFMGIGYGLDEEKAYTRSTWRKHGNKFGKILERIRDELTASTSSSASKGNKEEEEEEEDEEVEEEEDEEAEEEEDEEAEEEEEEEAEEEAGAESEAESVAESDERPIEEID